MGPVPRPVPALDLGRRLSGRLEPG
jgi:hypothetical protein